MMKLLRAAALASAASMVAVVCPLAAQTPPVARPDVAPMFAKDVAEALQTPAPAAPREPASPQPAAPLPTVCGQPVAPPAKLPPAGSGPVVWVIGLCFPTQGGQSVIEPQTYLYYIQTRGSRPSEGVWVPYDEKTVLDDFHRLWNTNFLDNLWIESKDYTFSNGVVGKLITYNMEERQRVKIVDYVGSKKIEVSKIEDKLKEANAQIRLDTFIDPSLVRKVEGIVRDMMKEKGFQFATVTHEIKEMPDGPKLVHLTFHLDEGPKVKIRSITFVGNKAISSGALKRQMKDNKEQWWLSWITSRGTYQEAKFDDDAEKMTEYYRDNGYIAAHIGAPELKFVGDSPDKKTRWVELRIPVEEGKRYKVGNFTFDGNTVVKTEYLQPLFKLKKGDYYSEKKIRKGLDKAREIYGAGGYFEFTGYPDLHPRDVADSSQPQVPEALAATAAPAPSGPPIVDVTMKMQEGKQYFINRITFVGNTTTRDNVIRREINLLEGGVFNTEALKYSIKRLNQLGYFKQLEGGKDVNVEKTPNTDNKVDIKVKLEEQNRNQLTFGAGVSQFEGFFGQVSFQTSNFMGRGESLTLSAQQGSLASNYQVGFTEPFLFDRNITGGVNLFKSDIRYIGQFTQKSTGGTLTFGFPLGRGFTRMFMNYSYQQVSVSDINDLYTDPLVLAQNPFLRDSLLIGSNGARTISKVTPSIVRNTIDNPIFPNSGTRVTATLDWAAGLGGNTHFYEPMFEGVYYWKQSNRLSLGMRGQVQWIKTIGTPDQDLPIFQKLFLGGEYSVRGFDIRTIGPMDPTTGLVLGGNKSLLFNLEENITIAGPVRLILFYDAGQVRDFGQPFTFFENIYGRVTPNPSVLTDPYTPITLSGTELVNLGRQSAFKTSTGAEIRFMMPVLNVPFRLIFAYNPQRAGVLDSYLQPQTAFQFRFAVGSTF